jgi:hypothetical protein
MMFVTPCFFLKFSSLSVQADGLYRRLNTGPGSCVLEHEGFSKTVDSKLDIPGYPEAGRE